MKKLSVFVLVFVVLFAGAAFCQTNNIKSIRDIVGDKYYDTVLYMKDPYANEGWSISRYKIEGEAANRILSHPELIKRLESVLISDIPGYIKGIYKTGDSLYTSDIYSYNKDINKSRLVEVNQNTALNDQGVLYYRYMGLSFISEIDENIDTVIKNLPVIQKAVLHDRFECVLYDAARYGAKYYQSSLLTVVKDNGKIVWYGRGSELGDVAITSDGRYMVACTDRTDYVTVTKDRIIAENYAGDRRFGSQMVLKPVSCKILSDNVVRLEYRNGCVEHWRVRLSDEDIEKNVQKWEEYYKKRGSKNILRLAGSKHLVWCNDSGKGKGYVYKGGEEAWDYHTGGPEPVYEDAIDMSKMKDARVSDILPEMPYASLDAGKTDKPAVAVRRPAGEPQAKTGWFARLLAAVKGFFARLSA